MPAKHLGRRKSVSHGFWVFNVHSGGLPGYFLGLGSMAAEMNHLRAALCEVSTEEWLQQAYSFFFFHKRSFVMCFCWLVFSFFFFFVQSLTSTWFWSQTNNECPMFSFPSLIPSPRSLQVFLLKFFSIYLFVLKNQKFYLRYCDLWYYLWQDFYRTMFQHHTLHPCPLPSIIICISPSIFPFPVFIVLNCMYIFLFLILFPLKWDYKLLTLSNKWINLSKALLIVPDTVVMLLLCKVCNYLLFSYY